jgi:hypothetical protein
MCQSTKIASSGLKLLIVFLSVMPSTALVIYILILKSGVPDMHVGIIMDSKDATFFEDIFPMRVDYCSNSQKTIINDEPIEMIEHNEQTLVENLWGDN